MNQTIKIFINDKETQVEKNSLLINALQENHANVPHFCYHRALGAQKSCKICAVKIRGQKDLQLACDTIVKEGMIVHTQSEELKKARSKILEPLLEKHSSDCQICDKAGECELQECYAQNAYFDSRKKYTSNKDAKSVDVGQGIEFYKDRCILCKRCVSFFEKITKTKEVQICKDLINDFKQENGEKFENPYSMNIVDLCPVGAMTSIDFKFSQRVWFLKTFEAICNGCSRGCNIYIDHRKEKYKDDTIYRLRPRYNKKINGYFICDYGRLSHKGKIGLLKTHMCNQEAETLNNIKAYAIYAIKEDKNILILTSPMLSCEELKEAKNLAHKTKASIFGVSSQYIEESFEDDMLKTKDKSPNRKAFKDLNICEDEDMFKAALKKASLVIVLENNYFDKKQHLLEDKKVFSFSSHKSATSARANIAVGILPFYEKSGTYINCDGIRQKMTSQINRDEKMVDLKDFLKSVNTML